MHKRQAPLVLVNVANLALFVLGVAVILHTEAVLEEQNNGTNNDACVAFEEAHDPILRTMRDSDVVATGRVPPLAFRPMKEPVEGLPTNQGHARVAAQGQLIPMQAALACEAPITNEGESLTLITIDTSLAHGYDREHVAVPTGEQPSNRESDPFDERSMVRCEQEATASLAVRSHEQEAVSVCETEQERSALVPFLFAMVAGAVMNVPLVTSLPML